jgi:hypothetical protein
LVGPGVGVFEYARTADGARDLLANVYRPSFERAGLPPVTLPRSWTGCWMRRRDLSAAVAVGMAAGAITSAGSRLECLLGGVRVLVGPPVFKTGASSVPAQAGSIPVRLRDPIRVRTAGATKYGWMDARDSTRICSTTVASSRLSCSGAPSATAHSTLRRTPTRTSRVAIARGCLALCFQRRRAALQRPPFLIKLGEAVRA